jgi:hypothetical protein
LQGGGEIDVFEGEFGVVQKKKIIIIFVRDTNTVI